MESLGLILNFEVVEIIGIRLKPDTCHLKPVTYHLNVLE